MKHEACGLDANKAQGKAKCFISIEAMCQVLLFCVKHKQRNAITILKNFCLNINMFAGPCSLNGGSLINTYEL